MDEGGGVEGLAGPLVGEAGGGEAAELVVDQGQQVGGAHAVGASSGALSALGKTAHEAW